jgi:peptidoglycan/LPS O-acetylase OafA/YrhL
MPVNLYAPLALSFWAGLALTVLPAFRRRVSELLVLPSATNQNHLPSLDGFRGLAALFVAVFHTWAWSTPAFTSTIEWVPFVSRGNKAVPIFVTLSGLLIYRSLTRTKTIDDLRRYMQRRTFRVFPVYIVTVAVTFVAVHQFKTDIPMPQYFLAEVFALRSIGFPFFLTPQTWSLYVEILFYVIAPFFVIMTARRPILWATVALVVFSLGDVAGPRELGLWKYFCCGVITAEIIDRIDLGPLAATFLALAGLAGVIHDVSGGADFVALALMKMSGGALMIMGGSPSFTLTLGLSVMMLLAGAVKSPVFRLVMESLPLRALGAVSYSLFMWHGLLVAANLPVTFNGLGLPVQTDQISPLAAWYMPLVVIPAMIALSTLSYLFIERPFLLIRSKSERAMTVSSDRIP